MGNPGYNNKQIRFWGFAVVDIMQINLTILMYLHRPQRVGRCADFLENDESLPSHLQGLESDDVHDLTELSDRKENK